MAPVNKIIAAKCKAACLKSIQRHVNNEQDYAKSYLKLKEEEKQISIRLANLKVFRDKNKAERLRKCDLVIFRFKYLIETLIFIYLLFSWMHKMRF